MHLHILSPEQKDLLPLVNKFKRKFYLVGGTAIALHLGHRMSIDYDLFCEKPFSVTDVLRKIEAFSPKQSYKIIYRDDAQLHLLINGVKLTFYHYPYVVPVSSEYLKEIKMPSLLSLAAMKALALGGRNKWKDYVDLYFLLKNHFTFDEIAEQAEKIFSKNIFNRKLFKGQLSYFNDVDYSEEVDFISGFEKKDEEIKGFLIEVATRPF